MVKLKVEVELESKSEGNPVLSDVWRAVRRVKEKMEYDSLNELIKNLPEDVKIPPLIGSESFYGDNSYIKQIELNRDTMEINSFPIVYTGGVWPKYIGKVRIIRE